MTETLDALAPVVSSLPIPVRAEVPEHLKTRGVHRGRVVVRATGSSRVGKVNGINAKYCHLLQRGDGYEMRWVGANGAEDLFPQKEHVLAPQVCKDTGYPHAEGG